MKTKEIQIVMIWWIVVVVLLTATFLPIYLSTYNLWFLLSYIVLIPKAILVLLMTVDLHKCLK